MTDPNRKAFNSTLRVGKGFKKTPKPKPTLDELKEKGLVAKASSLNRKPMRKRSPKQRGWIDVAKEIWEERPHHCEVCLAPITDPGPINFSHLLPRSTYPDFKRDKRNIRIKDEKCHTLWHEKGPDTLQYSWKWKKVCDLYLAPMTELMNFPSIEQVIESMVSAFNSNSPKLGIYSKHELRLNPITSDDVLDRTPSGSGRSPVVIGECRTLCYHACAHHIKVWDPLDKSYRYWKYREIGREIGGRSHQGIKQGLSSACNLLRSSPAYGKLLSACIDELKSKGFVVCNEPRDRSEPC